MTQNSLPVIDPGVNTGTELANWLNSWRPALESYHQGATRPSYAVPGMIWVNNANAAEWIVNIYDGTHDVPLLKFNPATGLPTTSAGNVNGPASSVAGYAATYADTTGKLLAQKAIQSNTTDTTAAALLINGAWGLGATICPDLVNIDDLGNRNGLWRSTGATTGTKPEAGMNGVVLIMIYSIGASVIVRQFFMRASGALGNHHIYTRMGETALGWSAWNEIPLADLYGVGSLTPPVIADLNNNALKAGIYKADGNTLNKPSGIPGVFFQLPYLSANIGRQFYFDMNGSADAFQIYTRQFRAGTTWGAWVPVLVDSGWIAPTLAGGITNASVPARYRNVNNTVHINGVVNFSLTVDVTLFTLPSGFRPTAEWSYMTGLIGANIQRNVGTIIVSTAGRVSFLWVNAIETAALTNPVSIALNTSFRVA